MTNSDKSDTKTSRRDRSGSVDSVRRGRSTVRSTSRRRDHSRSVSRGRSYSRSSYSSYTSRSSSSSSRSSSRSRSYKSRRRRSISRSPDGRREYRRRLVSPPRPVIRTIVMWPLSQNVTKPHINEIMSRFGKISSIDMEPATVKEKTPLSKAFVEYGNGKDAEDAAFGIHKGSIDGVEVNSRLLNPTENDERQTRSRLPIRRGNGYRRIGERRQDDAFQRRHGRGSNQPRRFRRSSPLRSARMRSRSPSYIRRY